MTLTLDDLDLVPSTPPSLTGAVGRRCGRHRWEDDVCARCGKPRDEQRSRRGRSARRQGNDFERLIAQRLGIRRVGQYGGPADGEGWIAVQMKVGTSYPERIDGWLRAIPQRSDRPRAVVLGDAPGPGHARRALIVFDLTEWADWWGYESRR